MYQQSYLPIVPQQKASFEAKKVQVSHFLITIKIMILILSSNHFKELLYIPNVI
jgi:hypothetical protein